MVKLHFDFRDVFRSGRYAFSLKKVAIHLLGIIPAYLIYEILVYGGLLISGGGAARNFWNTYALWPVFPFVNVSDFDWVAVGAMWLGVGVWFVFFFMTSTMVAKVTIQQLRGDNFFSIKEAFDFARRHWSSIFAPIISLVGIIFFIAVGLLVIGLIGKIPAVGRLLIMLSSIFTPIAFLAGLLIAYLIVVLAASLFFAPSVVAAADSDAFETVYQHFAMVWNQPWRVLVYESLLFGVKLICVPIWAIFCILGFALVMAPIRWLISTDMRIFMGYANEWLGKGRLIAKIAEFPYADKLRVFNIASPDNLPVDNISGFDLFTLKATAIFLTVSMLFIIGAVIAYLFSIASVGNTIVYTIVRKRVDGENLLEIPEDSTNNDALENTVENRTNLEENPE